MISENQSNVEGLTMSTKRDEAYRAYSYGNITYEQLAEILKKLEEKSDEN